MNSYDMTTGDRAYFSRREHQERANAARAGDRSARCVHLQLAARYLALLAP